MTITHRVLAGVDIGNSTTEACLATVADDGSLTFLGSGLTRTTGVKGTPDNAEGVIRALAQALESHGQFSDLEVVYLNEATPVISGLAMETITETVITESTMIGHDPRTPGGTGLGVGVTVTLEDMAGMSAGTVIPVVPDVVDFEEVAAALNEATRRGVIVAAAILENDDAVLVTNRLDAPIPVVDEVSRIEAVPLGMHAAVEVAPPGHTVRTLSNAYGIATVFELDPDQTRAVSPLARALIGHRSAVVIRTPAGDVVDRTIPAGLLKLSGTAGAVSVDVSRGAEAIMTALDRVGPLEDADGEAGTNVGGMVADVKSQMANLSDQPWDDIKISDILAVDTFEPLAVRGGIAGEVSLENAVALAAMVRTSEGPMAQVAAALRTALAKQGGASADVAVGGVEANMAVEGALTTPGTDRPIVVLDLGGGSTDAALLDTSGDVVSVHLAGAGDLVTRLIDAELGLDNTELAESIKRCPLGKVETLFTVRHEDGTAQFFAEPLPPNLFGRVVTIDGESMSPVPTRHSLDRIRTVRREAKSRVFVTNAVRALTTVAPHNLLRALDFVVLLGGCALDFEIPDLIAEALGKHGVVCGTANVRGTQGPRNAVASGLVLAHVRVLA